MIPWDFAGGTTGPVGCAAWLAGLVVGSWRLFPPTPAFDAPTGVVDTMEVGLARAAAWPRGQRLGAFDLIGNSPVGIEGLFASLVEIICKFTRASFCNARHKNLLVLTA
jgi:hypothetical protein